MRREVKLTSRQKINFCKKFYAEQQLALPKQYVLKVTSVLRKVQRKKATFEEINQLFDLCVKLERRGHFERGLLTKLWQKKSLKFTYDYKLIGVAA